MPIFDFKVPPPQNACSYRTELNFATSSSFCTHSLAYVSSPNRNRGHSNPVEVTNQGKVPKSFRTGRLFGAGPPTCRRGAHANYRIPYLGSGAIASLRSLATLSPGSAPISGNQWPLGPKVLVPRYPSLCVPLSMVQASVKSRVIHNYGHVRISSWLMGNTFTPERQS